MEGEDRIPRRDDVASLVPRRAKGLQVRLHLCPDARSEKGNTGFLFATKDIVKEEARLYKHGVRISGRSRRRTGARRSCSPIRTETSSGSSRSSRAAPADGLLPRPVSRGTKPRTFSASRSGPTIRPDARPRAGSTSRRSKRLHSRRHAQVCVISPIRRRTQVLGIPGIPDGPSSGAGRRRAGPSRSLFVGKRWADRRDRAGLPLAGVGRDSRSPEA